ncbi:ABC-2 family transporter protein [Sodalis endosymbiont of Spalangia cameroni]|uniref:ABC transporter permease n=1 Tax=Sodalis praecaptivus TaxID=1239307 RepID=UPI0031FA26F8
MRHTVNILRLSLVLSLKRAMQYRWEFITQGLLSLALALLQLVPLWLLFAERRTVAGWSFEPMLTLMGWYMMLYALVEGVIAPSLTAAVAGIRTGAFDYILLRPVDPLFLCSLADIRIWKIFDFLLGVGVAAYGWGHLPVPPSWGGIILAIVLALGGLTTAYALFVLAFSASFALISVQNLTNVLTALFGFARWPIHLFELPWRFVFRFVFPIAVMTSYPVMALMGQCHGPLALGALSVALVFFIAARWMWARALRRYRSASS